MNKQIRKHLNDAVGFKNKIIKSELKAFLVALQSFKIIKSFELEYLEQSNDEGGFSRQYIIKSINEYPIKIYTEYMEDEDDFINDNIKKMLFESKNTEVKYTKELGTLCMIINEIGEETGDRISFKKELDEKTIAQIMQHFSQ